MDSCIEKMVALVPTAVLRCDQGFVWRPLALRGYGWLPQGPKRWHQGPGECSFAGV